MVNVITVERLVFGIFFSQAGINNGDEEKIFNSIWKEEGLN